MIEHKSSNANFYFHVRGKSGRWEEYSGKFKTEPEARKWYNDPNKGGMLRKLFGRKLLLFYRGIPYDVPWIEKPKRREVAA